MNLLPYAFAKRHGILALAADDHGVHVLARAGVRSSALAEARRYLGRPLQVESADAQAFDQQLAQAYAEKDKNSSDLAGDFSQADDDLARLLQETPEIFDLLETQDDAPIIRMINALLTQAIRDDVSDIHIEPYATRSVVRFRVDGLLRDMLEPPRNVHAALVSRIKVMSQLDIAEKRLPQDGRISLKIAGRPVDIRVSTLPTGQGERVVLRLLDKAQGRLDLSQLGMAPPTLAQIDTLVHQPHGILLVTGPTGSGKTTTLYAALSRIDTHQLNVVTVEDPIEYDLDGIGQTQVNTRIDMTFARALRSILRQDPDVVMIGEIRDFETAQIAVQASLTGHLVLATLHTNDSVSAVTRLVDMGVEPFLLASSLLGVLAQRLVRSLCPVCRTPSPVSASEFARLELTPVPTFEAPGCEHCRNTGYKGRTGIYELFTLDDTLRRMVHERATEQQMRDHAVANNMIPLRQDGMRWVAEGKTSLQEVLRVTKD